MISEDEMRAQQQCFRLVYQPEARYVNDHCFVAGEDGTFHLFHIVGPVGKGCYDQGSEVRFGHAVSRDLSVWQGQDDILGTDAASRHEPHHVFAPYVCSRGGEHFLFYAGINQEVRMESMCLARSKDLFDWCKHPFNPVFRPSRHWAEHDPGSGTWACCRDAHVLAHPRYGHILYYVTWIKGAGSRLVALGAAVSDDLISWQDAGPVMVREMASEHATTSMESPCVVARRGLYYLFYKHRDATRLVVSDDPLKFTDKCDAWFSIAHAAEVFEAGGRSYLSSCSRDLLDLRHAKSDRTRGLFLACLDWEGEAPELRPFEPVQRRSE